MSFATSSYTVDNDTFAGLRHDEIYPLKSTGWIVTFLSCSIFGIPGNILTLVVVLNSKTLRSKPINMILAHQSIIDITVCGVVLVEEIVANLDVDVTIPIFCHYILTKTTHTFTFVLSTYNVTLLSIERYLAIVDPLSYDMEKVRRRLPYLFVGEWIFCILAFMMVPCTTIIRDGKCLMAYHMLNNFLWTFYSPYEVTIAFVFPLSISIFCYGRMFYCLRQSARSTADSKSSNVDKLRLAQMNIFKTCLLVIGIFIVCWTVLKLSVFLYMSGVYPSLDTTLYAIGIAMVTLNSAVNPYIYVFRYDDFKNELKLMMKLSKVPTPCSCFKRTTDGERQGRELMTQKMERKW